MEKDLSLGAAWMNGHVLPISQATIPVNDWGLVHSDITYDVVPVINGAFFRFEEYLSRFFSSMESLYLDPGMNKSEVQKALHQMVSQSGLRDSYVAMVCSRGRPKIPGSRDPRDCENHFFAWCVPYVHVIKPEIIDQGATAWISQNVYRIPEESVNPRVKNYHWGDFTQGIFEAKDNKYETVILLDFDGNVTEGPGFNVFAIKDGVLITPDRGVLAGVSRKTVLEIADYLGIGTSIRPLSVDELLAADEVFLSSSGGGVIPIVRVNETIYGNGVKGPISVRLNETYWQWTTLEKYRDPINYIA
ncbi:MAG: aminotransferase class IV [Paracoccaceae bacterium]|tara:strand:+ start:535 stop:1443 length:909 start_codon:yes stop_codon:yes gene_type:complete